MARDRKPVDPGEDEGEWYVESGQAFERSDVETYVGDRENLSYNNPFGLELERVWFDGKTVFAIELGEVELDFDASGKPRGAAVAQEYQIVYAVELDDQGRLKGGKEPERVEGQFNIYDSVPGMDNYSPLWQFNYVIVPRDYPVNSLRSEEDCLKSGYPIVKSTVVEN